MAVSIESIQQFDIRAFKWCLSRKYYRQLRTISRHISHLGDGIYYLLAGMTLYLLEKEFGQQFFYTALLGFAFEVPQYLVLKNAIKRKRPYDCEINFQSNFKASDQFSFPSGHTAAAFVMATVATCFYPAYSQYYYALAMLIGLSRIMLGVHFPTDILAGSILGSGNAFIAIRLLS